MFVSTCVLETNNNFDKLPLIVLFFKYSAKHQEANSRKPSIIQAKLQRYGHLPAACSFAEENSTSPKRDCQFCKQPLLHREAVLYCSHN